MKDILKHQLPILVGLLIVASGLCYINERYVGATVLLCSTLIPIMMILTRYDRRKARGCPECKPRRVGDTGDYDLWEEDGE